MTIKRSRRAPAAVPISVARGRLFELVEDVLEGRADHVALSHKGRRERVVLVRAERLEKLEAELAALRARVGPEPRPLRGIATLHGSADDVVEAVRARKNRLAEAKRETLFGKRAGTA